jgi:hypothetical protein
MARTAVVVAVAVLACALVAAAVTSHSTLTFEPTVPRVSVKRPAFVPAASAAGSDLPRPLLTAVQFVKSWVPGAEFVVKDFYVTKRTGVAHAYLRQVVNGLEVANGDANVNVDAKGAISSASHSFFTGALIESVPVARLPAADAARVLATYVNAHPGDIKAIHTSGTCVWFFVCLFVCAPIRKYWLTTTGRGGHRGRPPGDADSGRLCVQGDQGAPAVHPGRRRAAPGVERERGHDR